MAASYTPPPEAVTSVVVKREQWPSTTSVIGTMEAVHGVVVSADLPGTVAKINFDSGKAVREGDVLVELDTRQERAQFAALEAQRDLAKINYGRMQQLVKEGVISRSEYDHGQRSAKADGSECGGNPRHDRAEDDPRAVFGSARHSPGQPGPVSVGRERDSSAPVAESDLRGFRRAAAGVDPGRCRPQPAVTSEDLAGRSHSPDGSPPSTRSWTRPRATFRCRRRFPTRRANCAPACSCRSQWVLGASRPVISLAGIRHQLRALRRFGLRRHRSEGSRRARPTGACASSS